MTAGCRFDLAALIAAAAAVDGTSPNELRVRVRCNGRDWRRAAAVGASVWEADRWACRAGYHPAEIWPEWVEDHRAKEAS